MIGSLYLIPTGRLPSRALASGARRVRARPRSRCAVVAALEENVQASDTAPIVSNPIGIDGLGDIEDFFGPGLIVDPRRRRGRGRGLADRALPAAAMPSSGSS